MYENLLLVPYVLLICSASDKSGWMPFEGSFMVVDFVVELLFAIMVATRFRTTLVDADHYEIMERDAISATLWKDLTFWADLISLASAAPHPPSTCASGPEVQARARTTPAGGPPARYGV